MIVANIIWGYFKKNIMTSIGILVSVVIIGLAVRHYFQFKKMKEDIVFMAGEINRQDSIIVVRDNRIIVDSTLHAGIIKDLQVVVLDMRTKNSAQAKEIVEKDLLILDMAKGLKCVRPSLFKKSYKIVDCNREE
jgi:hypothetical protein